MGQSLSGKKAIVTGSARGLGAGIARILAREGADVLINYAHAASEEKAQRVADALVKDYGVQSVPFQADVTREEAIPGLFDRAENAFGGPVTLLVNNAGICPVVNIVDSDFKSWKDCLAANVDSLFLTCREFLRRNIPRGLPGRIINIASQAAFNGSKNGKTHYAASKGAVVSFGISLAKETARYGILVNTVCPGMVLTELTAGTLKNGEAIEKYNQSLPLGRLEEVSEVGEMVAFLAGDKASYSTGAVFDISGGMMSR
ncbi:MAG: SDR family oxidoreductase [Spirochaetales bacterium]|jgi:NAD(P)-dependent dehydrogenase (short-subunit alcohol dehydrogenase family)|nr:SDR family oxidoreductase [Spirochaetales bacterium]